MLDKTTNILSKSLDLYLIRHAVITDNIANAETPGYKARRVEFEDALKEANNQVSLTRSPDSIQRELSQVRPNVFEDPKSEVGQDRNSVDMDREMSALSKNDIKYSAASQMISKKFNLMKYAITEGNGS